MYTFTRFDLGVSNWLQVPMNVVVFSGCDDDASGTRSGTLTGQSGNLGNIECERTPVQDVGHAMHSCLSGHSITTNTSVNNVGSPGVYCCILHNACTFDQ
uniref:Uncharacterized protein n=1 Tax=Tanacetum cinerariifolium TaxID=118510 RepID=A0A6L2NZ35_TANCI|nr:hypothetical protein [Tanacetum cinerariifolium]